MTWFPDPLAIMVTELTAQLDGIWVADRLPDPLEDDLPAVWINPLPGGSLHVPWNDSAPLADNPSFDIDILARASDGPKALNDLAARVRQALFAIPTLSVPVVSVTEDVALSKRPDWNPRTLRVGGEYALTLSRI